MLNDTQVFAPAKLTLTLRMKDQRNDGFNNLEALTVFLPSICDELKIVYRGDEQPALTLISGQDENLKLDETNLVLRAMNIFLHDARTNVSDFDAQRIAFQLKKIIPAAAGLGGGSADAAATLRLLNDQFQTPFSLHELAELASEIGSDIPACVYSKALWMKGRGEKVEPIDSFHSGETGDLQVLVLTPAINCPTAEVFKHYSKMGRPIDAGRDAPAQLQYYVTNLHNDLAIAAYDLFPDLAKLRDTLTDLLSYPINLAGSGSTFFALGSGDEINQMVEIIKSRDADFSWRLCAISKMA